MAIVQVTIGPVCKPFILLAFSPLCSDSFPTHTQTTLYPKFLNYLSVFVETSFVYKGTYLFLPTDLMSHLLPLTNQISSDPGLISIIFTSTTRKAFGTLGPWKIISDD